MENYESPYTSYPEGYKKLCHDMLPWYMRPMKKFLMRLFLTILKDG